MKQHPDGYVVKLVRDQVHDALGGDGSVTYKPLPHDEHVERLRKKLIEEAVEYFGDPCAEELSHVIDVVAALCEIDLQITWSELEHHSRRTEAERGGFRDGIGMYAIHPYDE